MPLVIPFRPSIGRYRFVTVIEKIQYVFRVRWNSRDAAWYFSVYEYDETPIALGIKIVLGTYLGRWCNHPLFQDGVFKAASHAEVHADATFDNLGTGVEVLYYTRADMVNQMLGSVSEA